MEAGARRVRAGLLARSRSWTRSTGARLDAAEYIRPQRDFADIVVRFHRRPDAEDDEHLSARLTVRPTLPYPGLRELVGSLGRRGVEPIRWSSAHGSPWAR